MENGTSGVAAWLSAGVYGEGLYLNSAGAELKSPIGCSGLCFLYTVQTYSKDDHKECHKIQDMKLKIKVTLMWMFAK